MFFRPNEMFHFGETGKREKNQNAGVFCEGRRAFNKAEARTLRFSVPILLYRWRLWRQLQTQQIIAQHILHNQIQIGHSGHSKDKNDQLTVAKDGMLELM